MTDHSPSPLATLTERQIEVLSLMAVPGGRKIKEVARELGISPSAVGKHIENAKVKLGTDNIVLEFVRLQGEVGSSPWGETHLQTEQKFRDVDPQDVLVDQSFITNNPLVGLEAFDARHGAKGRLVLIASAFVGLLLCLLIATAILQGVSSLVSAPT